MISRFLVVLYYYCTCTCLAPCILSLMWSFLLAPTIYTCKWITGPIDKWPPTLLQFPFGFRHPIRSIMKFLVMMVIVLLGLWQQCYSYPIDNEEMSIRVYKNVHVQCIIFRLWYQCIILCCITVIKIIYY